jgi:ribonuclease Y
MQELTVVVVALVAVACGIGIGYAIRHKRALTQHASVDLDTKQKLVDAEQRAMNITENAETKAENILQEARDERKSTRDKLTQKERHLDKREEYLDERQIDLDSQKEHLQNKAEEIKQLRDKLHAREANIHTELERIAGLSQDDAYQELLTMVETEYADAIAGRIQKVERAGEELYEAKARNILLTAIHRLGNSLPANVLTASVEIPNDEIKGKVIGREGRNVRTFEHITGVDVLIDDVPGYITLSSFDPIRREIARTALEQLIKDGRIQPARIESTVQEAQQYVATTIRHMGEKAAYDAQVPNLPDELVTILGRLHFRTSYGQNVLAHSVEVAHLAAMIAEETGADVATARAGGLLHDIGKTMSHEVAGTHVDIGIRLLQKYEVDKAVILAMRSHHEEYPYETPESLIVQVADAISASRPGARSDSVEHYIKRLTELETIAAELSGVEKAFAISAGREIRVVVNPHELSEYQANSLARTIADNIESQVRYPGEIKVHVIRETRTVSYAR